MYVTLLLPLVITDGLCINDPLSMTGASNISKQSSNMYVHKLYCAYVNHYIKLHTCRLALCNRLHTVTQHNITNNLMCYI